MSLSDDEWGPWSLRTSTRPSRETPWPTGSVIPIDVDDQAPLPLLVGIALALVIGFIIIVYCICRRHNLLGGASSSPQDPNAAYQRAPTGDGTGAGYNTGVGVNAYPMAPVKSMFPPPPGGPQTVVGLPGKPMAGGINMGPSLQQPPPPPTLQHPYPTIPPDSYTPPYPVGYAPLPSYMPTSQSSHTSSASGPASDQGPSGFSSSPPAPAPAPSGMMSPGGINQSEEDSGQSSARPNEGKPEGETGLGSVVSTSGVMTQGLNPPGMVYTGQGYPGYGGQGVHAPPSGFQLALAGEQRGLVRMGGVGYGGMGFVGGQGTPGSNTPTMHPAAMDYAPGGGFISRVGSPMPPPGTTMTELDQL
ncbi:hypothetical protein ACOMHN_016631 [Nucella lapillus]